MRTLSKPKQKSFIHGLLLISALSLTACSDTGSPSAPSDNLSIPRAETLNKTRSTNGGLGFFDINSRNIPTEVKKAALSVFELRTMAARSDDFIRTVDISSPEKIESVKAKIDATAASDFDKQDKIVLKAQVDRCIEVNLKECSLTSDIRRGTGFLLDTGDTLVTNAHIVDGFFQVKKTYEGINDISELVKNKTEIRIFLFDSSGNLVVNPFKEKITISRLPEKTKIAKSKGAFFAEDSDYTILKVSKVVGTPLKRSKKTSYQNGSAYLAGYPGCTGCDPNAEVIDKLDWSDRGAGLNSDGVGLKFSVGLMLEETQTWSFFQLSEEKIKLWNINSMLFYSADSNHGSSGSPILDDEGHALGIHAGGLSRLIDGKHQRVSRGVLLPQ